MTRINMTQARLLLQIQGELLPQMREALRDLIDVDTQHTSPRIQRLIRTFEVLIPRLDNFQGRRERDFWNRVDHRDGHMIWLGEGKSGPNSEPVCEWKGKHTSPARVVWLLEKGEDLPSGRGGVRLRRTCGVPRCIAPAHQQKGSSIPGRTTGLHADKDGHPACAHGHTLRDRFGRPLETWPAPRRTPYCPDCYQARKIERAYEEEKHHQREHFARTGRLAPNDAVTYDTPEGYPLLVEAPDKPPVVSKGELDELEALFNEA